MRMKGSIILVTFVLGLILSQCSGNGNSSTSKNSANNESEGLASDALNNDGGDALKGSTPKDDGSWVYILDKKIYKKKQFEATYNQFLQIAAITGQVAHDTNARQTMNRKKKIMEKVISVELAYKEARKDPFFKSEGGKNIIQVFYKQALFQYYLFKEVLSKVSEPTEDELKDFYKKNKRGFKSRGLKGIETKKERSFVKMAYRNNKIQEGMVQHQGKLVNGYVIKGNGKVLEKYLAGKITKKMIDDDKEGKYWIVQVGKHLIFPDALRPVAYFKGIHTLHLVDGVVMHAYNSFPSGHSATAFGIFVMLIFLIKNRRLKLLWLAVALLTAFSRVYLSQHFMEDVLAGSLIGTLVMFFTVYYFDRYFPGCCNYSVVSRLTHKKRV